MGYRLYADRRYSIAHVCLVLYSFVGLATFGHFLIGNPQIPAFFYATLFTDGIAGLSILAFTVWSARTVANPDRTEAPSGLQPTE